MGEIVQQAAITLLVLPRLHSRLEFEKDASSTAHKSLEPWHIQLAYGRDAEVCELQVSNECARYLGGD